MVTSPDKPQSSPVSVIVPCYRCAGTIERAIQSVIQQTLLPSEIFLVDDCSNDGGKTLSTLYYLEQSLRTLVKISVIKLTENTGPGGARNAGWDKATQPYIAFLDADDSWHPQKIEIQYQWMKAHPNVILTGHFSQKIDLDHLPAKISLLVNAHAICGKHFLIKNTLPTRSVMMKRDVHYRFESKKRYAEDYLLWLNIILNRNPAWLIELTLAYSYKADFGEHGLTKNLWKMECGEIDTYRQIYQQGLISRTIYWLLLPFSLAKFARRLLLYYLKRIL